MLGEFRDEFRSGISINEFFEHNSAVLGYYPSR